MLNDIKKDQIIDTIILLQKLLDDLEKSVKDDSLEYPDDVLAIGGIITNIADEVEWMGIVLK